MRARRCCVWFAAWPALGASGQEPPAPAAPARELNLAAEAPERLTVGVVWENDSDYYTFFDPEDADYTNGIRLDVAWTPEFADRWAAALPLSGPFKDMRSAVGVAVGQNMYSPDAITDPNPLPEEHPWGAWLYGGFYLQRADATKLDTLELDLGVTGEWAGGEYTQKSIHRLTQSPEPMGWKYQNSEEIGANLVLQRTWKYGCGEQDRWRAEVLPYAGATLGTIYANASAGATARVGWNMADDFGMPRIGHLGDQTALAAGGVGVYLFGRLGGRAVAHDTFLDGSLFQDDRSVDKEPLVGEAQLGVSLRVTRFFDLDYSQTWWTEEFKTEGRGQHFGSWGFRLHFEY